MRTSTATGTAPNRVPAGVPAGGQFAPGATGESAVTLDIRPDPAHTGATDGADLEVFTRRYESVDEKVKAFQEELAAHVESLADDDEWNDYLDTMSRFHAYSPNNQILIHLQTRGTATRVAGFRTWQSLGRHVRKGEKGISILAPKVVRVPALDAAGRPRLDAEGRPVKERRVVGFTTASVFDVAQTDGEPLPDIGFELSEEPPAGLTEDLEAAIEGCGFRLSYEEVPGAALHQPGRACRRTGGPVPGMRARALAHELGHVKLGHLERMGDYHAGHDGHRGEMEVEADSFAYAMLRGNGMSTEAVRPSGYYVAGWSRQNPDTVRKAAENVSKAVKDAMAGHPWRNSQYAEAPGPSAPA